MKADLEKWVHESYTIEKYNATYSRTMYYVRDACFWPSLKNIPLLTPPPIDRKGGPIKKNKRRDKDEGLKKRTRGRSTTIKCPHCRQLGHNKAGCTLAGKQPYQRKKQPPTRKPTGRPRKVQLTNPT